MNPVDPVDQAEYAIARKMKERPWSPIYLTYRELTGQDWYPPTPFVDALRLAMQSRGYRIAFDERQVEVSWHQF
jgi:hypothetical protein